MRAKLSTTFAIILAVLFNLLVLVACTRERPAPGSAVAGSVSSEPEVVFNAPAVPQNNVALEPEVRTIEVVEESAPDATPTTRPEDELNASPRLMQYTVQAGDTIFSIAERFKTDPLRVRQLNYLEDDSIFVGQIIDVPYIEGADEEGVPTPEPEPFVYIIEPYDTFSELAVRFDIPVVELIAANQAVDPHQLVTGQEVLIPGYQPKEEDPSSAEADGETEGNSGVAVFHIVQQGEGLNEIADKYGVNSGVIAAANNITNRNLLRLGQELVIPGVTRRQAAIARGGTVHIVQLGESLSSIGQIYGISPETIISLNGIENGDTIYVGQELIVPKK